MMTVPNLLTLFRIFLIFPLLALTYVSEDWARWGMVGLFVLAGVTDFLDGYLARRWNQGTAFGRFLDPIADKLLVAALLVGLMTAEVITGLHAVAVVLILLRELFIAGLREFLGQKGGHVIPVTFTAKLKTTSQLVALAVLLLAQALPGLGWLLMLGLGLLWLATILTLWSGTQYLLAALPRFQEPASASQ